jgi:hypothetical protein
MLQGFSRVSVNIAVCYLHSEELKLYIKLKHKKWKISRGFFHWDWKRAWGVKVNWLYLSAMLCFSTESHSPSYDFCPLSFLVKTWSQISIYF